MFRILYLTDSHLGEPADGWGHHPIRPDLVPTLLGKLAKQLQDDPVDLIVHGGDLIGQGTGAQQAEAAGHLQAMPAPTVLSLGNHDLADPDAYAGWTRDHTGLLPGGRSDFFLRCGEMDLYVLGNLWRDKKGVPVYYWEHGTENLPCLTENQLGWLDRQLARDGQRPAVVAVHAPLDALPPDLTGLEDEIHPPHADYVGMLTEVLDRYPRVRLVLSGHCHANCAIPHGRRWHLTTAAFVEPPFEYRRIEIDGTRLRVRTASALDPESVGARLNPDCLWTRGRDGDRSLTLE